MSKRKEKGWTNPFLIFQKWVKEKKIDGLTPLYFFKNEPNMRKIDGLTPFQFLKMSKRKEKGWTNPFPFFQKWVKEKKKDELTSFHF